MTEFLPQMNFKKDFFLNEESNLTGYNSVYSDIVDRKCGEIFVLTNAKFWFQCTFCDERFHNIVVFQNHIQSVHIRDAESNQNIKDENPLDLYPNEKFIIKVISDRNCNADGTEVKKCKEEYKWELEEEMKIENLNNKVHDGDIGVIKLSDNEEQERISTQTKNKNTEGSQTDNSKNENVIKVSHRKNKSLISNNNNDSRKKRNRKKVYSCANCKHIASDQLTLEGHMQSCHDSGTRYQCEECGKCFSNGSNLRHHLVIHSGTRPYRCEFCDAGFSHSNSLKAHRYLHTGNRPYKCVECGKGFVSSGALKIHMREHTGETPYVCQFCGKAFATQCSYKRHMISHSGQRIHKCQQCEKSFLHKETLNTHMACHSTEKHFACDICPKRFNHKKNLAQHKKLHSNIKQYICKICSKDFAQNAGLHSHMKCHRNKE